MYFLDPHEVQVAVEMDRPPFPQQVCGPLSNDGTPLRGVLL